MINLINDLINKELESWKAELLFYMKIKSSNITSEEKNNIDLIEWIIMGAIKELEEIRGGIQNLKNEYAQYIIYAEEKETNGVKWTRFYTLLYLVEKNKEGLGAQRKYVNVKFNPLIDTKPFKKGGIFTLKNGTYTLPLIYEIKEENGKLVYPYVWINEVAAFQELPTNKNGRDKESISNGGSNEI